VLAPAGHVKVLHYGQSLPVDNQFLNNQKDKLIWSSVVWSQMELSTHNILGCSTNPMFNTTNQLPSSKLDVIKQQ
jgi:hypothetical protein